MTEFATITPADSGAFTEIMNLSDEILARTAQDETDPASQQLTVALETGELGTLPLCDVASDAVTRAAHQLGIVASREFNGMHLITSFSALDALPSDDDLILCRTWGQFARVRDPSNAPTVVQPYFGRRADIKALLPREQSYGMFKPGFVRERQIVHQDGPTPNSQHRWLQTSPQQVARTGLPLSEVSADHFTAAMWTK